MGSYRNNCAASNSPGSLVCGGALAESYRVTTTGIANGTCLDCNGHNAATDVTYSSNTGGLEWFFTANLGPICAPGDANLVLSFSCVDSSTVRISLRINYGNLSADVFLKDLAGADLDNLDVLLDVNSNSSVTCDISAATCRIQSL